MSSVVIQIGQCGNQLGEEFWNLAAKDPACVNSHAYHQGDGHLRCVLVDSEPKVVHRLISNDKGMFRPENVTTTRRGRGGNWALGYYGLSCENEVGLVEKTVDRIQREVEGCESFSGFVFLHSLSGGTGSGLGSKLMETLRDEFPLNYQLSCAVAPHVTGESPLQSYNSLLCLAYLQKYCDGSILFHNDEMLHRLQRRARNPNDHSAISLSEINQHIASCLAGVFLPIDSITAKTGTSIGQEPWEMLRSLCPMPALKFMHLNTLGKSKVSWELLADQLSHSVKKYGDNGHKYASIAMLCAARGDTAGSFHSRIQQVEDKLRNAYNPVAWNPFPMDVWVGKQNMCMVKNVSASVTVAANYSNVIDFSRQVWTQAQQKFHAKAYLHWYWKHGCDEEDFSEAFEAVANVAQEYATATS